MEFTEVIKERYSCKKCGNFLIKYPRKERMLYGIYRSNQRTLFL